MQNILGSRLVRGITVQKTCGKLSVEDMKKLASR